MLRPSGRLVVAGIAVALAVSTPAIAHAQGSHSARFGSNNLSGSPAVRGVTPALHLTTGAKAGPAATHPFPSASSTVVASTGFIDGEKCGYFWSASRGDSVAESFSGPGKITRAVFKLDVTENFLAPPNTVDWTASINGKDVGSFSIAVGQTGPVTEKLHFNRIRGGGTYDVKIRVTNEVPGGGGSVSLRYAGSGPHAVVLRK